MQHVNNIAPQARCNRADFPEEKVRRQNADWGCECKLAKVGVVNLRCHRFVSFACAASYGCGPCGEALLYQRGASSGTVCCGAPQKECCVQTSFLNAGADRKAECKIDSMSSRSEKAVSSATVSTWLHKSKTSPLVLSRLEEACVSMQLMSPSVSACDGGAGPMGT